MIKSARPGLILFSLLAALMVMLAVAQAQPSGALAWMALVYYAALCWFVTRYFPAALVLLLWFVFVRLTTMISGVAIETGGYMPEILQAGEATGAFIRLAAVYTAGILGAALFLNALVHRMPGPEREKTETLPWAGAVFALVAALCGWAFVIGLKNGFPALEGIDRILYWKETSSRFLFFFLGNRPVLVLFLGVIFSVTSGRTKYTALGLFCLVMILSLLFAEKFTSICMILFVFVTPVFLGHAQALRNLSARLIPLGIVLSAITLPAILLAYGVFNDSAAARERLKARITSQAEIWYVADSEQAELATLDTLSIRKNIAAMISSAPEQHAQSSPYLGARYYMARYLAPDRYAHYNDRGVTLTMATEGYLLKMFGWLGMLPPYLVLIGVYCLYQAYMYYAVVTHNPLRLVLAGKLLVWANFGLNQGYFWFLIGLKAAALVALIIFAELILYALAARRTPKEVFA